MFDRNHLDGIAAIVGSKGIVSETGEIRAYEIGARYDEGKAAFVVRPATTAQVSDVVAYLVSNGIPFVPQGGNTGLVGGSTPDSSGAQVVLSLDRLRSPIIVDEENRTVEVGSGVRLSTLNDELSAYGMFFPVDLGADPTIGGMVATNTGGARFLRYGGMRRQVLGVEVVLADPQGTVLDLATGLRKDNSRLDLKQFFIGTGGAFGIVTKAVLELQRAPRQRATALIVPSNGDAILPLLATLEETCGEYLSAFEGISRNALERTFSHIGHLKNPFARGEIPPYAILLELTRSWVPRSGELDLSTFLEGVLSDLFDRDEPLVNDALVARSEDLWLIRHSLTEGLKASGHVIAFDLSLRRSDLHRFRTQIIAILDAEFPDLAVCDFGHVGDGGIHFNLVYPRRPEASYVDRVRKTVLDVVVHEYGGSFSGEHALGRSNQAIYDHYTPDLLKRLSVSVKDAITEVPIGNFLFGQKA
ncbi:FAD-binding oxidoreductase [Microvirga alba]|uniref:FAD-binding oxidoreductase n=1 Tax=Microvirga alba TaxID=2791025 RepID=A0A931BSI9_9HYPH|nr:FAD-binding oxidoreductase [Microvirga alba]MBF9233868.1 FAD-binding oxidoreductase [Microvirga alba]